MKKLIVSLTALILIAFIFASCSDNNVTENQSASAPAPGKGTGTISMVCANNLFPDYSLGSSTNMTFTRCSGGTEVYIQAFMASYLWSYFVDQPSGEILGFSACGGVADDVKAVDDLTASAVGNYPKLTWGFVYSHYYVVQRKIGTNAWQQIAKIPNRGVQDGYYNYPQTNKAEYTDNSISLSNNTSTISYRVFVQSFDENSLSSDVKVFPAAMSVSISGPTNVWMPAKGNSTTATWTATVTGGTPPYTYLWNQPGDNDNQSYSVTYYYSAGQSDHTVNLACTVTDALGVVKTATYPYVEDYSPYNPDI